MSRRRKPQPPRRPARSAEPGDAAVWVQSDVMPDGTYAVTVHAPGDRSFALDRARAVDYTTAVYEVAARAEYDAAVFAQLVERGLAPQQVAAFIGTDLRADRPEIDPARTAPLVFTPGVNAAGEPFLHVHLHVPVNGGRTARTSPRPFTQWTPGEAREHAGYVLDCLAAVDLDAGYRRCLVGVIGLDDPTARAVVGSLASYRPAAADPSTS